MKALDIIVFVCLIVCILMCVDESRSEEKMCLNLCFVVCLNLTVMMIHALRWLLLPVLTTEHHDHHGMNEYMNE
jgi:hypothetical protein